MFRSFGGLPGLDFFGGSWVLAGREGLRLGGVWDDKNTDLRELQAVSSDPKCRPNPKP